MPTQKSIIKTATLSRPSGRNRMKALTDILFSRSPKKKGFHGSKYWSLLVFLFSYFAAYVYVECFAVTRVDFQRIVLMKKIANI
jgi:hypothetical protein